MSVKVMTVALCCALLRCACLMLSCKGVPACRSVEDPYAQLVVACLDLMLLSVALKTDGHVHADEQLTCCFTFLHKPLQEDIAWPSCLLLRNH